MVYRDFLSALDNLKSASGDPGADIAVVTEYLDRKEANLLDLRRAGLSGEVIDACFLLSNCGDSLAPERLSCLRANPLARSGKARKIREKIRMAELEGDSLGQLKMLRKSLERALEFLETDPWDDPPKVKERDCGSAILDPDDIPFWEKE